MKRIVELLIVLLLIAPATLRADEGMWLPILLKTLNIKDMQTKGFKLSAEDLYSVNHASLKDAVVQFGNGCTGEVVSPEGLVLTNHHCGYGSVQALSSVQHDYLTVGYAAMNWGEELPCKGLTVSFLDYMRDVTPTILKGVKDGMPDEARAEKIKGNIEALKAKLESQNHKLRYEVTPLFYGNQYYLFAYTVYRDIRLVVAPPSAIGKFGGDTDNWMWPRHTGDFTMFRIYAGKDNQPAAYSKDNVPYKPKKFLTISTKGVGKDDFALVYGYPGRTNRYLLSDAVESIMDKEDPRKVALREKRLAIMDGFMKSNDTIRIQYSSKYAHVANAWKKWHGESLGLRRMGAVRMKQELEKQFQQWADANPKRKAKYGDILPQLRKLYAERAPLMLAYDYYSQGLRGIEVLDFTKKVLEALENKASQEQLREMGNEFFKDYDARVDRKLMEAMLTEYIEDLPKDLQLDPMGRVIQSPDSIRVFAERVYTQSPFSSKARYDKWVSRENREEGLLQDYLAVFVTLLSAGYEKHVYCPLVAFNEKMQPLYRRYVQGLMEMNPKAKFFPDANFTLRTAWGKVEGYEAREGVDYDYKTTLDGVVEKVAIGAHDWVMPKRLRELYEKKDYGRWAVDGTVPVCFSASIHTTGGNSGSPVLNAKGELIGLNFDRVWEGTMSDIMFDPAKCRNITVDIRYVLFLIDKYAKAPYLIEEMKLD